MNFTHHPIWFISTMLLVVAMLVCINIISHNPQQKNDQNEPGQDSTGEYESKVLAAMHNMHSLIKVAKADDSWILSGRGDQTMQNELLDGPFKGVVVEVARRTNKREFSTNYILQVKIKGDEYLYLLM